MAKFTDIELILLGTIKEDRLKTSLALIRETMEDIWGFDSPRIINDYTDHGEKHSERIADYVCHLVQANDGKNLSSVEMYLLLSGIYLHDIGMQCDVVKHPTLKSRAENYGAKFTNNFEAITSSTYSIEEQVDIRKNHSYLTAAWIDNAHRTGNGILGKAAKTIPNELVDDLIDMCLYHTKLPITNCPVSLKFDPGSRKQLLAALLRFADELDIDSNRVSLDTVKIFSLNPSNSVYWWLHNRAKVVFVTRNVISLTLRLNRTDNTKLGNVIKEVFVDKFSSKNRSVIGVLARNGIPIVIDDASGILENDREESLPVEIVQELENIVRNESPISELAKEIRVWLSAMHYEVTDPSSSQFKRVEMKATFNQGTVNQSVLIWCYEGEIKPGYVEEMDKLLDRNLPQGWIISDKRVANSARERAALLESVKVFTYSEFQSIMVWGPYFDYLTSTVEKENILDQYVDPSCNKVDVLDNLEKTESDHYQSLDSYIDDWLDEIGDSHFALLGDFGSGKTWFCKHYAFRQLKRYLENPLKERLPILLTLRNFTKVMTSKQLVNDALLDQYKLRFIGGAYEIFQTMNQQGKLLIILDGFDEMARKVDFQTVIDNFWELTKLIDDKSKVILTSRTEFFRDAQETRETFEGKLVISGSQDKKHFEFEVLYIEPFSDSQISELITKRWGVTKGANIMKEMRANQNLMEMARKPVLIDLLLKALDVVNPSFLDSQGSVYKYATKQLIDRNVTTGRTFTDAQDKYFFMRSLAWDMIVQGNLRVHYSSLPNRIMEYFGEKIDDQHVLDIWDYDLRNQTLLHRDGAGYYEFAHKSIAEYFAAEQAIEIFQAFDYERIKQFADDPTPFRDVDIFLVDLFTIENLSMIKSYWNSLIGIDKNEIVDQTFQVVWDQLANEIEDENEGNQIKDAWRRMKQPFNDRESMAQFLEKFDEYWKKIGFSNVYFSTWAGFIILIAILMNGKPINKDNQSNEFYPVIRNFRRGLLTTQECHERLIEIHSIDNKLISNYIDQLMNEYS